MLQSWSIETAVELFLAATAALEVQMLVCVCVHLSVTLATAVQDFCRTFAGVLKYLQRTSKGLPKDFQRTLDFIVYKIFTSRSPQVFETCSSSACVESYVPHIHFI